MTARMLFVAAAWLTGVVQPVTAAEERVFPPDWKRVSQSRVGGIQAAGLSRKLGGRITSVVNHGFEVAGESLKIIDLRCASERDAERVHRTIAKIKKSSSGVARRGRLVTEISTRSRSVARLARYVLRFQPARVRYRVRFDAVPLADCDYGQWNRMFNLLAAEREQPQERLRAEITERRAEFKIGDELRLRRRGQGTLTNRYRLTPPLPSATGTVARDGRTFRIGESELPTVAGLPVVAVEAVVESRTFAPTPAGGAKPRDFLGATGHWPVDDPEVARLAAGIVAGAGSSKDKVRRLLRWFRDPKNMRYDGKTRGSRYGVPKVLAQRFGHCWDYADLFVTLARAAGVPCRQVLGWIAGGSGHVWAEFLVDDQWIQVDPTSGIGCGSDYVPYLDTADGRLSLVYASLPQIEILERE